MPSIFTRIINREIPAHIVWENEKYIAILDIKPLNPGHTLLIPKDEANYIFDMSDEAYADLFLTAKKLSSPIKKATQAQRIGLIVEGFGVDHVHIHLIPINGPHELDPNRAKDASTEELQTMKDKIISLIK